MKQHILIVCHGYNAPFVDVCNQYAALFTHDHFEVTVVYLVGKTDAEIIRQTQAEHVYFLAESKRATRGLKLSLVSKLLKLCRTTQFTTIICHRYKPVYLMTLVSYWVRLPKIIAVMHELGTLSRSSRRLFIALIARKRLALAGVSAAVRHDILTSARFLQQAEVMVLPNVLDVAGFEAQLLTRVLARQELKLATDAFIIGNIGRLVKNKDQISLITAFATLVTRFPHAQLVIMGQGQLEPVLRQLATQLGVADKVIFTGFIAQAFRYIKAFDVFISASKQEAFGRVLLEAMVAKAPIIATAVDGVPEVIGSGVGILVPPQQPAALAKAMQSLLTMSQVQLDELGNAGYERVKHNFSLQTFKTRYGAQLGLEN